MTYNKSLQRHFDARYPLNLRLAKSYDLRAKLIQHLHDLVWCILGRQRWTGTDRSGTDIQVEFNGITQQLGISAPGHDQVYFLAPGGLEL